MNGKRIFIKGGHHQGTYPATLQFPPTREFAYREVKTIKEAGFNFSRLWQKPTPFPFLDAADELGLLLQIEPPLGNMQDSPYLLGRATREVTELIKRDRNRASIVLWNMINENDPPVKVVRQLCRAARELDPTRLITESAGGPSRFYLPGSSQGVSYLTEHPYPGAPIAEDVYDYQASRGVPGQLCFFSEYGYGGMNDLDSVLARYGDHPRTHMEDYAGHVKLKQRREKGFAESGLLRSVFGDLAGWREASQAVQAETVRWHTEAMRSNPVAGGYNYVQVFDSNAIEIDGLVDFWRERRKQAFEAMQEVNQPLQLIIRCTPMNARAGEEVKVRVTLVNEERIGGQKRLRVGVKSPGGREVWRREENVEAKPWVTVVYEGGVKVEGETGRYGVEAVLWEGSKAVVRKEDYYTVFAAEDMKWPREGVVVFDPEEKLERYLKGRGVRHEGLGLELEGPAVIMVTGFTALWRRPEEYRKFMHLFSQVERGCSALFLGVPSDGVSLLAATHIGQDTFLSPFALEAISPFSRITSTEEGRGQQRIGPYGWGLTEVLAGVPIAKHAIFEGLPGSGLMGREYGNVLPVEEIQTDWKTSEDIGSVLQIYNYGRGKIILTSFNLLPNLDRDALAEKLLSNLVNYAAQNLPSTLEPERPETAEKLGFEDQGYQDCLAKYVKKS